MAYSPAKRQAMEICQNLHPRKIWVNLRTQRPSTLIFVRTLSQFTRWGSISLLTVRGRKSGKPIVTPIAIFVQERKRYLVTTYEVVNWVRNLRAAGGEATLTRGRCIEKIHALELEPESAARIFREAVRTGPDGIPVALVRGYRFLFVLPYLNVTTNASLEEFEREVLTHPVFLLQSVDEIIV